MRPWALLGLLLALCSAPGSAQCTRLHTMSDDFLVFGDLAQAIDPLQASMRASNRTTVEIHASAELVRLTIAQLRHTRLELRELVEAARAPVHVVLTGDCGVGDMAGIDLEGGGDSGEPFTIFAPVSVTGGDVVVLPEGTVESLRVELGAALFHLGRPLLEHAAEVVQVEQWEGTVQYAVSTLSEPPARLLRLLDALRPGGTARFACSADCSTVLRFLRSAGMRQVRAKGGWAVGSRPPSPRHALGTADAVVVSMPSASERLQAFEERAPAAVRPFAATVGKTLDLMDPDLDRLFALRDFVPCAEDTGNAHHDHGYRLGVLGCAMSHLRVWEELAAREDLSSRDAYLVLEDDVWFNSTAGGGFERRWPGLWEALDADISWGLTWLGFTDYDHRYWDLPVLPELGVLQFAPRRRRSRGGGTFAYVVRKSAARLLVDRSRSHGVPQAIDWFMLESLQHGLTGYLVQPPVIVHPPINDSASSVSEPYPLVRLLPRELALEGLALHVPRPVNGSQVRFGTNFTLGVELQAEHPDLFAENLKHAQLCIDSEPRQCEHFGRGVVFSVPAPPPGPRTFTVEVLERGQLVPATRSAFHVVSVAHEVTELSAYVTVDEALRVWRFPPAPADLMPHVRAEVQRMGLGEEWVPEVHAMMQRARDEHYARVEKDVADAQRRP